VDALHMDFSHPTYLQIFLTASLPIMGLAYALVGGLKLWGWTVIPMIIGGLARKTNIQMGFLIAAASGAVFLTLILIKGVMIG
jgi:hypothetical protein